MWGYWGREREILLPIVAVITGTQPVQGKVPLDGPLACQSLHEIKSLTHKVQYI